jgi:DNA-binding NtrC family response regulator
VLRRRRPAASASTFAGTGWRCCGKFRIAWKFFVKSTAQRLHVLVVDDELLLRWSLAEVLRLNGHTVLEASSASDARQVISSATATLDVVLLDYRLPDSQDLGLLKEIRARIPHAAVVLITAYTTPDIVQSALDLGVHRVINKPFDMDTVDGVVRDAHRHARDQ